MSETQMSTHNGILSADRAMPSSLPETEAERIASAVYQQEVVTRILDPKKMNMAKRGTITIDWTDDDGEYHKWTFPLKSISADKGSEIMSRHSQEEIPSIPQIRNEKTDKLEDDMSSPDIIRISALMSDRMTRMYYDSWVEAYDGDIISTDSDEIVWSAANRSHRNREAAIESLKALEVPPDQLIKIYEKITELSGNAVVDTSEDLKKNSEQPTESQEVST